MTRVMLKIRNKNLLLFNEYYPRNEAIQYSSNWHHVSSASVQLTYANALSVLNSLFGKL